MSAHAAPIGGPIANGRFVVLMLFMLAVVVLLAVRLAAGLGAVSAMSKI